MKTLQFQSATRRGDDNRKERHYHDYLIGGESLHKILGLSPLDLVTPFGWNVRKDYEWESLYELIFVKKPRLITGRVPLYVCPECGDLACGAITAEVLDLENKIIWKAFGYENDYEGVIDSYAALQPIELDRDSYYKALLNLSYNLARK
ncbi:hypothetical protein [Persicitalea jodogahamensis]|uniref:Uncharacterized protein n=1 Tax=Persicitalea jodogahamensis TaxID=402147 RepID=A0A8J3D3D3_9BACT|nr:hypothetical protein [Persicitalea jodogahamensis]GHB64436.1 hypothetical protein GCM10007390_17910 [Persicitalea jodogahamensis]